MNDIDKIIDIKGLAKVEISSLTKIHYDMTKMQVHQSFDTIL